MGGGGGGGGGWHCIDLSSKFCSKLGACILFRNTIQSFKFSLNDAILDAWKTCRIVPKVFYFTVSGLGVD